jgi:murein DD-endopeptidase MepM/ murein hydrolase activator NlpD
MIFTNKLLKIINKRRRVLLFVIFSALIISLTSHKIHSLIKLQKLQLKDKQNHIELITQENQTLLCANERLLAIMDSLPLGSPILDTMRLSSNYGWRRRPLGLGWGFHSGIDIYAAWSDTVHASGHGIVKKAYWLGGYGRCIVITHAGGYESYYAHLYRMFVREGDSVVSGQPIGRAGNSGNVTGPHLHYEIRRDSETADPLEYMDIFFNNQLIE